MVFGASTVQGYWDSQGGWADRLKRYYDEIQLEDLSKDIPHVMNLGISGDGAKELLTRIESEIIARQNEKGICVLISIGTNSAAILNGSPVSSTEQFKDDLSRIIDIAGKYTDKILIVGLPTVDESRTDPIAWADMRFRNDRIQEFEKTAEVLASDKDLVFVGVNQEMQNRAGEGLQSHDGLHPNDTGHQLIFELIRPALDELLKVKGTV